MSVYFGADSVQPLEFKKILSYVDSFEGRVGIEMQTHFHVEGFEEKLKECMPELMKYPIGCHSPYYESEYSAEKGTLEYERSMELLKKTLCYVKKLRAKYMVFHHNNHAFKDKEHTLRNARENFYVVQEICGEAGIPLVVENAGIMAHNNMLLNQEEFIQECRILPCNVLIDIGHANANRWDLPYVMNSLKDKIVAYHIHNNDGVHDSHKRIFDGTLDFNRFLENYRKFTPDADLILEYSKETATDIEGAIEDIRYVLEFVENNE